MPFVVRRINRAKWDQLKDANGDVSADAITICLKTTNNDLSVWRIDSLSDLEKAILALVTGACAVKLSTIYIVVINEDDIKNKGLQLTPTDGDTTITSLVKLHQDISSLTYNKLGAVKDLILHCFSSPTTFQTYTRKQLKDLIKDAITNNSISISELNPELVASEKL
ncbi:hypothetical protein MKQ68_02465 [Chitinophaga horti]|uniref:Uncharacterized protein n=1 Tax=Chitinophaga horti TaxID=2920382 RepID=A0ABY6J2T8_9BACT|nr:hypothetical protein [Chitinophaga horti]UYQ93957.1 hypothetical protein MKQ68_02465 [Chitinophaga horti]